MQTTKETMMKCLSATSVAYEDTMLAIVVSIVTNKQEGGEIKLWIHLLNISDSEIYICLIYLSFILDQYP